MNTEAIIYLLRKTNLTRSEIGKLTISQFNEIIKEVYYQESIDEYRGQHSVASILAAIYNTIPRKRGSKVFKAEDFLKGDIPQRNPKPEDSLETMTNQRGIKLPTKELKERK